jgi:ABC-type transport system involved in multi-copper enzyme maturation permease subunit
MSALVAEAPSLDLRRSRRVPMRRLVLVELRKMADTRAGRWLLIGIAALATVVMILSMLTFDEPERTFTRLMGSASIPQAALLPVLGILLVTSEWTQRTALVTFTLEPVRLRVVASKIVAAILFGLGAVVITLVMGVAVTAIFGNEAAWDNVGIVEIAKFALLQESTILQGLVFGLAILNSAAAIAAFFIVPTAFGLVTTMWEALADVAPWININAASGVLLEPRTMTGEEWGHLGVTHLVWIGVPLIIGLTRVLRKEVK